MKISHDIEMISNTIKETVQAERIYLFGSYAYGQPNNNSDYDFFVVIPNGSIRPIEAMQKIHRALSRSKRAVPIDVLAATSESYAKMKDVPRSLENKVSREGLLLYER